MLKLMNDYEYQMNIIRTNKEYKLIDHEKDAYISYVDIKNNWLWSMWFKNGRMIHEADCRM